MTRKKREKGKTKPKNEPQIDTLTIVIADGVPMPEDKPGWTYFQLLTVLHQAYIMTTMKMMERGILNTLKNMAEDVRKSQKSGEAGIKDG